jgi:hypothetical protein
VRNCGLEGQTPCSCSLALGFSVLQLLRSVRSQDKQMQAEKLSKGPGTNVDTQEHHAVVVLVTLLQKASLRTRGTVGQGHFKQQYGPLYAILATDWFKFANHCRQAVVTSAPKLGLKLRPTTQF